MEELLPISDVLYLKPREAKLGSVLMPVRVPSASLLRVGTTAGPAAVQLEFGRTDDHYLPIIGVASDDRRFVSYGEARLMVQAASVRSISRGDILSPGVAFRQGSDVGVVASAPSGPVLVTLKGSISEWDGSERLTIFNEWELRLDWGSSSAVLASRSEFDFYPKSSTA